MALLCADIYDGIERTDTCENSFGGTVSNWIGNKRELLTVSQDDDGVITGFTVSTGSSLFDFQFETEVGSSFTQSKAEGNGITQTIVMTFQNMTQEKYNIISKFRKNYSYSIVRKPNATYWLTGVDPSLASFGYRGTFEDTTGQAQSDIPQLTLTLTATVGDLAKQISNSVAIAWINS